MPDRVSRERKVMLEAYFEACSAALRLQAWEYHVLDDAPDNGNAILSCQANPMRWGVSVWIGSFFEEPPLEQRQAVAHELVHVIQADLLWYATEGSWRNSHTFEVARLHEDRLKHELERQADFVARLIVHLLPEMPVWPL